MNDKEYKELKEEILKYYKDWGSGSFVLETEEADSLTEVQILDLLLTEKELNEITKACEIFVHGTGLKDEILLRRYFREAYEKYRLILE